MLDHKESSESEEGAAACSKSESDGDEGTVEVIRRYLAEKLGFFSEDKEEKAESLQVKYFHRIFIFYL